jgi:5-methylcytosine-specific restriction endonuclease McrA
MPMELDRYPEDWKKIALAVKEAASWICQHCGKPCRRPGESLRDFKERLDKRWIVQLIEIAEDETGEEVEIFRTGRFVLSTADLDQNPGNSGDKNLMALCSPCHLRYDRRYFGQNSMAKRERRGQLRLFNHEGGAT